MEYSINKEALGISTTAFEGSTEQSIDLDFNLPDYCPDIQRILKCQVYPKITSRNLVGDRLNIDGIATVSLMYLDEGKKAIKYCEHSSPFSSVFNLKNQLENVNIITKTKVEYINCRAVSPRRLDIHGAFSVSVKIQKKDKKDISCAIDDGSIEQKKSNINVSNLVGLGQQTFNINETLELSNSTPTIESIIRSEVVIAIKDYRAITNKLIVNAQAFLNLFYISNMETGQSNTAHYSIPISQIVDIEGIEDDGLCAISLDVLNHDLQVKVDGSGNGNLLSVDMKVVISASAYENKEISVLDDAYSTEYEVTPGYETTNLLKLFEKAETQCKDKCSVEFSSSKIVDIIDIWAEQKHIEALLNDDNIIFKSRLNICILALNDEDEPTYSEKMVEFEYKHPWQEKPHEILIDPSMCITEIDSNIINNQTVEISPTLNISANIYANVRFSTVAALSADEEKPIKKDNAAALTVYFANKGDDIWNIAKRYNTSAEAIKNENELKDNLISSRKMLLIPM